MRSRTVGIEKRLHPRLNQELPISVAANGFDFTTATKNISCLGAYCHVAKYLPPFTKVAIKLVLPVLGKNGSRGLNVDCKGVIVRSEDDDTGGFNIAIFFNEIRDEQRRKISQYIQQFIP